MGEWDDPEPDDTFYYDEAQEELDSMFDTQEFDDIYSTYVDAKNRLNQLRQSRGFYPVVAVVDGGKGQAPLMAQGSGKGKSKSPGKSKSSSKGKGSKSGKGPSGKQRARSAMVCLRCGKPGHFAANCSTAGAQSSSPKKRPADDDTMVHMVLSIEEFYDAEEGYDYENEIFYDPEEAYAQGEALVRAGGWLTPDPDACIQDQGASSFLAGSEYILRYLKWLEILGYPMDKLNFKQCDKSFRFGGDATGQSKWMIELPTRLADVGGKIQAYVIYGATPMLFGRPLLEALHAEIDFGRSRMRMLDQETWRDIPRGRQGAMLLRLAEGVTRPEDFFPETFDLRCEDDHNNGLKLNDFLDDLNAHERFFEMTTEVHAYFQACEKGETDETTYMEVDQENMTDLLPGETSKTIEQLEKTLTMFEHQLAEHQKTLHQEVHHAREHGLSHRKRLIWEVYAGEGRITQLLQAHGDVEVMRFGWEDGWDFNRAAHRKALLRLCDELEPDEIYMSPSCTLWSRMQQINVHNEAQAEDLQERREVDRRTHLTMCKKLYYKQVRRGDHAHIEHPHLSLAWETPQLRDLPGHQAIFDQCAYGAVAEADDGSLLPIKKTTKLQTTKWAMFNLMSKRCDGQHVHQRLEGRNRCKKAENYQTELATALVRGLLLHEGLNEQVYTVHNEDDKALTGVLRKLGKVHGSEAVRIAYRLHRNLGHPRKDVLLKMLKERGCNEAIQAAVQDLHCPYCEIHSVKKGNAPGHLDRPTEFNAQVQADVLWLEMDEIGMLLEAGQRKQRTKRIAVLIMVDVATRYMAARTVPDEKGISLQKALERAWIQFHGPPKQLYVDEGTGWASDSTATWCEQHDIELRISPGQAHTRTSIVERRHQLVRKAVSIFMLEHELKGLDGVQQALSWVVPSVNSNTFVNGFTPSQLALGREPSMPGLLSDERTGPLQLQMSEQERLHRRLTLKFSAQQACGKAEIDVKLRRALLRRYTGRDEDLHPGERCLYWRDAADRAHTIRWKGPAIVLAIERNPDTGTVSCYWLAHGTVLLRASTQHVRKLVNDTGTIDGSARVQQALRDLRQRQAVRIVDLRRSNKRSIDEVDPEVSDLEYTPTDTEAQPSTMASPGQPDGQQQPASEHAARSAPSRPRREEPQREPPDSLPPAQEATEDQHDQDPLPSEVPDDPPELPREQAGPQQLETGENEDEDEEPMGEPSHMQTPKAPGDPADLPAVPEDHDLDQPPEAPPTSSQSPMPVDATYIPPAAPESFQDRRRRFDQQETIWTRKKARTDEPEVEVGLHSMDFSKTTLPEGWTYDKKNNEFVLGATQDWWSFEDGFLVRNHVWSRTSTYHPEEFPVSTDFLQTTTGLSMQQGTRTIYVNSTEEQYFADGWTGKTLYPLTQAGAEHYGLHYIGDLTNKLRRCKTLRGRGHIWQAVGMGVLARNMSRRAPTSMSAGCHWRTA